MPLPVFHSVASYSVYRMMGKSRSLRKSWRLLGLGLFLGILPDFDFLPGALLGNPSLFHRDFSHSPLMAGVVSLLVGMIYGIYRRIAMLGNSLSGRELQMSVSRMTLFAFLTYSTHLVLDCFSAGIPLFWPLTGQRFSCPMGFFLVARGQSAMIHDGGVRDFFSRILSPAYSVPLMFEVLMVVYVSAFLTAIREMSGQSSGGRPMVFVRVIQVLCLTTLGLFVI